MEYLSELRDRVMALPALENRMKHLQDEIWKSESEVADLLRQYERESLDVERIQKETLSTFILKVIGKYEDRLEKERREEIDAKLAYDRAAMRLESLMNDKDELASRLSAIRTEERSYQAELAKRRQVIYDIRSEPNGKRYAELENERNNIISQISEIKEVQYAAERVRMTAHSALKSLRSAEGWATYDALTRGGILSHMAKYSHIDDAEHSFHRLSSQLADLKSELGDVHGLTISGIGEISSAQRTVDFWFDNIFTDLSVRGQIKGNIDEINRLLGAIDKTESALLAKLREEEARLAENRRREEEMLLSL